MTAVAFDTLTYTKELERAGLAPQQAEAFVHVLVRALREYDDGRLKDLATKQDLKALEERIARLEVRVKELDERITRLEVRIEELDGHVMGMDVRIKDMDVRIKDMDVRIKDMDTGLRIEMANLRADVEKRLAETKSETIKWVAGLLLVQSGVLIGAMLAMFRVFMP